MKKILTILRNVLVVFVCLILCTVTILLDFVGSRQNLSHTIQTYMTGGLSFADKDIKIASYENAAVVSKEIVSEGTVLLKNDNNILPLEGVDKINMFGYRAAHPYLSGTGSSGVEGENSTTFRDAFANVGIEVNDALYQAFFDYGDGSDPRNFTIVEPNADDENFYSEQKWAEYEAYSDTAVYVIGRTSGEGADLAHGYLTISDNELEVLHNIEAHFKNVIVMINAGNAMELGFLDETAVDAALLINYTGCIGTEAVADIIVGNVNPSGKTIDIYAYDHSSHPSYYSSGIEATRQYADIENAAESGKGYFYVDYTEDIYVGYKYYETRYVDNITGDVDEQAYAKAVQYPFGYGLSYTSFDQKISKVEGNLTGNGTDEVTVTVNVTNIGNTAGKNTVELYSTPPYTIGGIEKSAVNLITFGKTDILAPGESQEVTLTFTMDDISSYDYNDANNNGHKGYELESGEYIFSIRSDSHTVLDQFALNMSETGYFDYDSVTGNEITNQFDDVAGADETEEIVYLSRADWEGTFSKGDGRAESAIDTEHAEGMAGYSVMYTVGRSASEAVYNSTTSYVEEHYADNDETNVIMPTTGAKNGISIADMAGLDYDDPLWEDLLDELTIEEMQSLIGSGSMGVGYVKSIDLVQTSSNDGTAGIVSSYSYNGASATDSCYAYPNENCLAATWNLNLAYDEGCSVGQEAVASGVTTWYAPGANIHRTPYGGRNSDYYSEDPIISGTMAASVVQGGADNGLNVMTKHFALNEQETARNVNGIYTWCTEQAMREIYLKPFEIVVKHSDAKSLMSSFNRIGATWTGNSYALLTSVLRDEWGFKGMVNSDAWVPLGKLMDATHYMTINSGLRAGNDIWLQGFGWDTPDLDKNKAYTVKLMRQASHRILYSIADCPNISGKTHMYSFQKILLVVSILIYAFVAWLIYMTFIRKKVK